MGNPVAFSFLFMIIPLYAILVTIELQVVSGQCLSDQQSLLLQLKNNLKFNSTGSKKLMQWNQSSDCCTWEGVTCEEGRVTGLNLSNESISGGIFENSSLFNLQYLRSLDLSYNKFNSTIPSRIGNLTNLNVLNFSNSGFDGQIPKEISSLTRLFVLDLSTLPYLSLSSLKLGNPNLMMLVQNLSQLQELYLDGVNISAAGNEWGQALSSSLTSLRVLSLSNCYVSGPIDHSLLKLHSLSVIRLDNNNLSAPFPEYFAKFSNLTSLHLSSCGLHGTFPKEIFKVPTLRNLDISFNKLLEGSFPEFPPESALQSLVIASTNFSGHLPASIGNLKQLSRLDLSYCHFHGKLPTSMSNLTELVYLDLSVNNFTGPIPSFSMSRNLSKIQLSQNGFTGAISSSRWEGLLNLVDIDLRNNSLSGSIPPSLFSLPLLQKIQLSNNQFDGPVLVFPNASSTVLDTLDLSSNNLQGPIPLSIFKFKNLRILSLSSNNFNGTIPLDSILSIASLTSLDLSYNNLSVNAGINDPTLSSLSNLRTLKLASCKLRIFPYLKNQSKLVNLDLSQNQIHGEIPNWIWAVGNGSLSYLNLSYNHLESMQEPYFVPNLFVLDLHFNHLRGNIPILPQSASYIDLSSNKLTSSIPTDIGKNLWFTTFFSLSNNSLTGIIPESLCNASYLQVLDLARNNLSGRIPACVPQMSERLGVLNLRKNNFNGTIPDAFPVNCALETLDLSENLIEGKVPEKLVNCKKLEVLNLGNNKIIDNYPCQLKKISTVRVLVLRSNKFHGPIGCPHINGTWKNLQIVDLAHNNFSGELPGKYLTNWQGMIAGEDDVQSKLKHLTFQFFQLSTSRYYQNAVTVTMKGLDVELVKILTLFTSIDFSNNHFQGPIPKELGQLQSLLILNLSQNAFTGEIPTSLGNLRQLESLDLSRNILIGEIPKALANLNFLSFLNLSDNQLAGKIPSGSQLQTFSADSFEGNKGLCGPPLTPNCSNSSKLGDAEEEEVEFDWMFIYAGIGFVVGAGDTIALLMFWEKGSIWLDSMTDKILIVVLPMLGFI
nr:receptor-like protein 47 [Ziziphus jujuba var. spinosa]